MGSKIQIYNILSVLGLGEPTRAIAKKILVPKEKVVDWGGILSIAPHNNLLLDKFIKFHLGEGASFVTSEEMYSEGLHRPKVYSIHIRHDVDYSPHTLDQLINIEVKHGVKADIHVIVNGHWYSLAPFSSYLRELSNDGFMIGLHTCAPATNNPMQTLEHEIKVFEDALGFRPRTFSIHGASAMLDRPEEWPMRRQKFVDEIAMNMEKYGFIGSSNLTGISEWIEDCRNLGELAALEMKWAGYRPSNGQTLGALLHPCHWETWLSRWNAQPQDWPGCQKVSNFIKYVDNKANCE